MKYWLIAVNSPVSTSFNSSMTSSSPFMRIRLSLVSLATVVAGGGCRLPLPSYCRVRGAARALGRFGQSVFSQDLLQGGAASPAPRPGAAAFPHLFHRPRAGLDRRAHDTVIHATATAE